MKQTLWSKYAIKRWHLEALPDCTVNEQRIKASKESKEFFMACKQKDRDAMLEELADVYIVNTVLWLRYLDYQGRLMISLIEHRKNWDEIADAIDRKMDINVMRRFVKINGEWRHVE